MRNASAIALCFVLCAAGLVPAALAQSPVTLRPTADGTNKQWTNNAGTACTSATCYTEVNEASGATCSSPVAGNGATAANKAAATSGLIEGYALTLSSIPIGAVIDSVVVHGCWLRGATSPSARYNIFLKGARTNGAAFTPTASWANFSTTFTPAWTRATGDTLEIEVENRAAKTENMSTVAAVITYHLGVTAAAETCGAADGACRAWIQPGQPIETAGASDSAAANKIGAVTSKTAAETAAAGDGAAVKLSGVRAASEAASAVDSATGSRIAISYSKTASETAVASDSATGVRLGALYPKTAGETAAASDSATGARIAISYPKTAAETAAASDSASGSLITISYPKTAAETAAAADSGRVWFVMIGPGEAAGASDLASASKIVALQVRSAAEVAGTSDAAVLRLMARRAASDAAGASDFSNVSATGLWARDAFEPTGAADVAAALLKASRAAPETAGSADSAAAVLHARRSAAEAAGASDAAGAGPVVQLAIKSADEVAGANLTGATILLASRPPVETAGASESVRVIARLQTSAHEFAGGADFAVVRVNPNADHRVVVIEGL